MELSSPQGCRPNSPTIDSIGPILLSVTQSAQLIFLYCGMRVDKGELTPQETSWSSSLRPNTTPMRDASEATLFASFKKLFMCVNMWYAIPMHIWCIYVWVWAYMCYGVHMEIRGQPWITIPAFLQGGNKDSLLFALHTPGYHQDSWLKSFWDLLPLLLILPQALWSYRCPLLYPVFNGFLGLRLKSSHIHNNHFTHWALSLRGPLFAS